MGARADRCAHGDRRDPRGEAVRLRLSRVAPTAHRACRSRARRSVARAARGPRERVPRVGASPDCRASGGAPRRMIRTLDPLTDPRWRELVQRDARASAFHTPEWLDALRRTYGFVPVVYTTDGARDELRSAIPFCAVASWLTGRRLVSLPFSDHCEPLVDGRARLGE